MDTNKIFIDMAQRAHEFAEMCRLMQKIPDMPLTAEVKDALDEYAKRLGLPKEDPEAWREEYRKKKEAGVKFEKIGQVGLVWLPYVGGFENGIKKDYREVPQEDVSESFDIGASLLRHAVVADGRNTTADDLRRGADILNDLRSGKPTIPPHAAERALWKAQREAGTNEVWQWAYVDDPKKIWTDIRVDHTPTWQRSFIYRAKPMKLTARICMVGKAYPMSYIGQDWEFTGTREEYRAECEKYGYVVLSEIKEVVEKPKTVKYYFAMLNRYRCTPFGRAASDKDQIIEYAKKHCYTIIGDIEEREIEA